MKKLLLSIAAIPFIAAAECSACSNIIVTKGASTDGSSMVSYAADSHWLYGELYFTEGGRHAKGSTLAIREWDSNRPLGNIAQVERTYRTVGNMNERQVIIGETTWGGRLEQMDTLGIMDYGSIIYTTLQRASSAREAIGIIVELANTYGYPSEGETFSIADKDEAWIMDLVGKGSAAEGEPHPGIVWVARRIPDGYVSAHANQARITRFPWNDPENCLYAPDVASYARSRGWYSGSDEDFSFREAYCPLDFGTVRACDARAWSACRILCDGVFTYPEDEAFGGPHTEGETLVSRPADDWLRYAMGYDLGGEMPLFVKPQRKVSVKDVADAMRDHFEGTPMDMTQDIGAGGNACPYRWRPMDFEVDGQTYVNERAIATQQTGFWFVAQARGWLPDVIGGLQWFGCDDTATSYLTPIYASTRRAPECLRVGNGNLLKYSPTSQFWMCNRVTNACYKMYDNMAPFVRAEVDRYEHAMMFEAVPQTDSLMLKIYSGRSGKRHGGWLAERRIRRKLTSFTCSRADAQQSFWASLEETLLVKFIDGNVKAQNEDGSFKHSVWSEGIPDGLEQPGYTERWKRAVVRDNGDVLRAR